MAVAIRQKRNLGYDEWPEISSGHSPKKLAIRLPGPFLSFERHQLYKNSRNEGLGGVHGSAPKKHFTWQKSYSRDIYLFEIFKNEITHL